MLTTLVHDELIDLMPRGAESEIPLDVVVLYTVSAFMLIMRWWLEQGMPCEPEQVNGMFRALTLPGLKLYMDPERS